MNCQPGILRLNQSWVKVAEGIFFDIIYTIFRVRDLGGLRKTSADWFRQICIVCHTSAAVRCRIANTDFLNEPGGLPAAFEGFSDM